MFKALPTHHARGICFKTVIKTERFHDVSPCEFWFETCAGFTFESFCASMEKQDL